MEALGFFRRGDRVGYVDHRNDRVDALGIVVGFGVEESLVYLDVRDGDSVDRFYWPDPSLVKMDFERIGGEPVMQPDDTPRLSPEEFERWQLEGEMVFCRRCGLMDRKAVRMEVHQSVEIGPAGYRKDPLSLPGWFAVYRCPDCGHRALSEIPESPE